MKTGIFFGGPSREREISFAGGRTVYDNLNKSIFQPIPIFVDSFRNLILLDWQYIYKGTIRDFCPPVALIPESDHDFQIYEESIAYQNQEMQEEIIRKLGRKIEISELPALIDFAFLTLHGSFGEDGQIQGLLDSIGIPYTGSGLRACSIGMDKAFQKKLMSTAGFACPEVIVIQKEEWLQTDFNSFYPEIIRKIGYPVVVRPANQGSSIGVSIIQEAQGKESVYNAIEKAFFRRSIRLSDWITLNKTEKIQYIRELIDIRDGLGFPVDAEGITILHPDELLNFIENQALVNPEKTLVLNSHLSEQKVILEQFIEGREFSCIVLRKENGEVVALPPTEIVKGGELFDYKSKYLPGLSRKLTPINLLESDIGSIRTECERLYRFFEFGTYARIDGFFTPTKQIFLNDPNTTSGMMPSSFFFHQAAEIGLNPSEFLTLIIRTSIQERIEESMDKVPFTHLLKEIDEALLHLQNPVTSKKKVAVFFGGYSFERHISVESGRNIFEKLASSTKYEPIPIFVTGNNDHHDLYQVPINLLLKDNADDIRDKILHFSKHPVVEKIKQQCKDITVKYASSSMVFEPVKVEYQELANKLDGVFIALHGRPGEDGTVQAILDQYGIPFNGSSSSSSAVTINKYNTLQLLRKNGFTVANQLLVTKSDFEKNHEQTLHLIEDSFDYPFIAKPNDDGCSSAVKIIRNREQLLNYCVGVFRDEILLDTELRKRLKLGDKEEFPQKDNILFESLITADGATHFLEITGGLLTHIKDGTLLYEMFEPSEALAGGEVLSLEEKFLAGEGQNITPARFSKDKQAFEKISAKVKSDLQRAAEILNIRGYARIDAFVRIYSPDQVETIIIEVNSLPGMTPATCIFHQSAINGYKPYEFIDQILEFAFNNKIPTHA